MEARFLAKVNKIEGGCWEWTGYKSSKGYGRLKANGSDLYAHRVAYELWVGPIPSGLDVRHKCDNPCCVNPDHLKTGTHQDNMDDKVERNRQIKGENHGNAKLTEDDVVEIRVLLGFGVYQRQIARQFGISQYIITRINTGKNWKHVNPASAPSR
jgi:hypothetical protein